MADVTNEIRQGTDALASIAQRLNEDELRLLVAVAHRLRAEQEAEK